MSAQDSKIRKPNLILIRSLFIITLFYCLRSTKLVFANGKEESFCEKRLREYNEDRCEYRKHCVHNSGDQSPSCCNIIKESLDDRVLQYHILCPGGGIWGPNQVPKSCKDIQNSCNYRTDGEYDLYLNWKECKKSAKVYCVGMNTTTPLEYVTLPSGISKNYALYYNHQVGNREETKFEKIRLKVPEMDVVITDFSFAVSNIPGVFHRYGEAGDCFTPSCYGWERQGKFRVDITGTSFRLPTSIPYQFHSWPSCVNRIYYPSMSADRLRWSGRCGGHCGGCWPKQLTLEIQGC